MYSQFMMHGQKNIKLQLWCLIPSRLLSTKSSLFFSILVISACCGEVYIYFA